MALHQKDISGQLSVAHLSVARNDKLLIEDLSFSAKAGDMIWISGPNGSGKTSLLKCLAGLLRPTHGDILWNNVDPQAADCDIAYHGHGDCLKPNLTVAQNLKFWQRIYGSNSDPEVFMKKLGVIELRNQQAKKLSAGQSRRVALARLLMKDAKFWLLDEPGAPMDEDGRALIQTLLEDQLAKNGIVLLASHRPPNRVGRNARHMILERGSHAGN